MRFFVIFFIANLIVTGINAKKDCKLRLQRCENKKPPLRKQVCGTDNKTYANRCELLRVQCTQNTPVTVKHSGKCKEKQPCWMDQNKKMAKNSRGTKNNADYIPDCQADGTYAPVQCYLENCWCVTPNGRMIPGTSVRHRKIECPKKGKMNSSSGSPSDEGENISKTGCDQTNRSMFTENLVRIFKTEYNRRNTRGAHYSPLERLNATTLEYKAIDWKFDSLDTDGNNTLSKNEYKDLKMLVRKVVKPKRCSRKFVRICDADRNTIISRQEWITCLNSTSPVEENMKPFREESVEDADVESEDTDLVEQERDPAEGFLGEGALPLYEHSADAEKEHETKVNDCFADRKSVLDELKLGNQVTYTPECTPEGRYKKVQCFPSTGYCWCVMEDSGKPIPGTSVRFDTPKCDMIQSLPPPMQECPDNKKFIFIKNLINYFHQNLSNANIDGEAIVVKESKEEYEEKATRGFHSLDVNKNKVLDKKEWKSFRSMVSTMDKTFKKCGRRFLRYCDSNNDKKVTLNEWFLCLSIQHIHIQENHSTPSNGKRRGINPIESYLKADD